MRSTPKTADGPPSPSIFARRPVATGIAVGGGLLLPHVFLPPRASVGLVAVVIALIASIYFGLPSRTAPAANSGSSSASPLAPRDGIV